VPDNDPIMSKPEQQNLPDAEHWPRDVGVSPIPGNPPPPVSRRSARLILALVLAAIGLWIARDFLIPLGWALVLAIAVWPLYRWVTARGWLGSGSVLPPLVFTSLIGLVLVIPLGFAAIEVGREGQAPVEWLRAARENGIPEPGWLVRIPAAGDWAAGWWREHLARPEQAGALLESINMSSLADWSKTFAAEFMSRVFVFFITMLALFFLFRDGAWLGERLLDHADRLFGDPGEQLAARMVAAARGTFNGTVLVAFGEGMLIGVGYFLTGVPRPMLFTALTIAVAMLPFGAWLAFTAASLLLLSQGAGVLFAGLLFGWGALVMLAGDNFIQPVLVGGSVRLPFLWALRYPIEPTRTMRWRLKTVRPSLRARDEREGGSQ
jgi:predicted PurR-regulated permease PerM